MTAVSYAPYSHFHVGAAVLTQDGTLYTGCNVENASYPAGICAERTAIFKAASEGHRKISAIAIAGGDDSRTGADGMVQPSGICAPCGVCRQVMREFCDPKELKVLLVKNKTEWEEHTLEELLPLSFGPEALKG